MEKHCSDSFPYYHFLHSAENSKRAEPAKSELPQAPGLPVILRPESEPSRLRSGSMRRWLKWLSRSGKAKRSAAEGRAPTPSP